GCPEEKALSRPHDRPGGGRGGRSESPPAIRRRIERKGRARTRPRADDEQLTSVPESSSTTGGHRRDAPPTVRGRVVGGGPRKRRRVRLSIGSRTVHEEQQFASGPRADRTLVRCEWRARQRTEGVRRGLVGPAVRTRVAATSAAPADRLASSPNEDASLN